MNFSEIFNFDDFDGFEYYDLIKEVGNKSLNLKLLYDKSYLYNVAQGIVITDSTYRNKNIDLEWFSKDKLYAVRSSAVGEDGKENSFAGIFKSKTNVPFANLNESINCVYDSFTSRSAEVYCKLKNTSIKPCILIQEMIPSDVATVVFYDNGKVIISINEGACDNIVSGRKNSYEFEFDLKDELSVKKYFKEIESIFDFDICLNDFFNTLNMISDDFNKSFDGEFCYDKRNKKWYVLQIRNLIKG